MDDGYRAMAMTDRRHVLIVAGTDSSGGAGIARDIETVAAFGLRTCLAVTAVTVQTHAETRQVETMPPDMVVQQICAAMDANPIVAIKIGMLACGETVEKVAAHLRHYPHIPVVLDPVLAASSGGALFPTDAVSKLVENLLPQCALITPNLAELAVLSGMPSAPDLRHACRQAEMLINAGSRAVLVKGGHCNGPQSTDVLMRTGQPALEFNAPRLSDTMRGTGCMLSSACAAGLAQGLALDAAVRNAKQHVFQRMSAFVGDGCRTGQTSSRPATRTSAPPAISRM